ncbi:MAG TPA: hypothetical protein VHO24_15720, partial [Opitutaceae bacterium]|nr:hypothetical protein [Opitutaceae bacterium]
MPKRSSKDPNVSAFNIVQQATGSETPIILGDLDSAAFRRQIMQEMGRRGGKKGGKARALALSKKERSEIAKKAAK